MSESSAGPGSSGEPGDDERRPRAVYGVGSDPDVRFSLANERTALAWVRTGLSLVAGGVALTTLASFADLPWVIDVIALVACLAGGALALSALFSWRRAERALRLDLPLPAPVALPWLVIGVVVLALVLAGYAVFELAGDL
ncbi:YidH family protein [Herbiconiux sp. VKM Ac-1786]|uniref:YidH family protein n=1 Tax=Herbiconiux sp. VKM Ac-1786 TaxID=2783824 RepID=UPI00351C895F